MIYANSKALNKISVEEYLAAELNSKIKHEFIDGVAYAMA
ncbi:Uma2 family endonuclease [Catenovulum maritimum]|nr:Uma2 family endonuclease [Catenovulum maritimum]